MKKLLALTLGLLMFVGVASADTLSVKDVLEKVPALKQGIAYSLDKEEIVYLSTIEILTKDPFALEVGFASDDALVLVGSVHLLDLKDYVQIPILDLLECNLGVYAGYSRIGDDSGGNNEFDYGLSATLINIKF